MLGVGAVCEWPKKGRRVGDCDSFQLWSAEVSMPRGHGGVVAHFSMVEALGRSERKVFWGGVLGCCEEGLEHWSKATPRIDGEGDEDHFVAYEVADDVVTFDEWGCCRCWFVGASEFSTFMSLKIGVCIGSDEG